jgi:hypothetical protein
VRNWERLGGSEPFGSRGPAEDCIVLSTILLRDPMQVFFYLDLSGSAIDCAKKNIAVAFRLDGCIERAFFDISKAASIETFHVVLYHFARTALKSMSRENMEHERMLVIAQVYWHAAIDNAGGHAAVAFEPDRCIETLAVYVIPKRLQQGLFTLRCPRIDHS